MATLIWRWFWRLLFLIPSFLYFTRVFPYLLRHGSDRAFELACFLAFMALFIPALVILITAPKVIPNEDD